MEMADASERIREHRERKERLEAAAEEARALLSERRVTLDKVETIAAYAQDMSEFLKTSELTERRALRPLHHPHPGGLSHRGSGCRRGGPQRLGSVYRQEWWTAL